MKATIAIAVEAQQLRTNDTVAVMYASHALLGELRGTVSSTDETPLAGAQVKLTAADHAALETSTGPDGSFAFARIRPGPWTVEVSMAGFTPVSASVTVHPGGSVADAPVGIQMPPNTETVSVVASVQDVAEAQLHFEEQQRLIGILPNFFVSYDWNAAPLTAKQKFSLAMKTVADPGNLLLVGTIAGVQQATDQFNGYGQGAAGYGRRYGADLGNLVSGTFASGAIYPAIFHQDPRYFYKGTGSVASRLRYALSSVVICRGDNGRRQPAFSTLLGDMSAGAISNLYYDGSDRKGASLTIVNGLLGIAGDAMNDVLQEFVLPKFTRRQGPRSADQH